ncbi:hypothetical protein D3C80_1786770 [compost metagenome]
MSEQPVNHHQQFHSCGGSEWKTHSETAISFQTHQTVRAAFGNSLRKHPDYGQRILPDQFQRNHQARKLAECAGCQFQNRLFLSKKADSVRRIGSKQIHLLFRQ